MVVMHSCVSDCADLSVFFSAGVEDGEHSAELNGNLLSRWMSRGSLPRAIRS